MNVSIMQQALGEAWDRLDDSVKAHYKLVSGTKTEYVLQGTMDEIYHSFWAKPFLWAGWLLEALVPYQGAEIPVTVCNWTTVNNNGALFWYRTFHFPRRKPYVFRSRMEFYKDNQIIEYVRFKIGTRMRLFEENGALVYKKRDYAWKLGKYMIPIPS